MHDLRFALRSLIKSRGFAFVAIIALALGIGANTAIFSLVYGVVLRPLPFPEQERLLFVGEWSEQVPTMSVAYPNFIDWRARQKSFSAMGVFRSQGFNYVGNSETERVSGAMASHDLFQALGVAPVRGRLFRAEDDQPGAERTVLLSAAFWHRVFGSRDSVVGEKIQLSGNFYTVVGIMPPAIQFPTGTDLWVPVGLFAAQYQERGSHPGMYVVARLKPGVAYETGVAELKTIADQLAHEYASNARQSVAVQHLADRAFGTVRTPLYILLGAAGFVLLIACANVANLQLARAHARGREFAVRSALGASRAQIIRQLLVESLLLGGVGCALGILVGQWGLDALRSILPANLPRLEEVGLNGPVLAFAIAASLTTSVVFGLVPALHAANQDLRDALAQGTRAGGSASGNRWRAVLISGEFALTCVLLVGAGLMIRTLSNLYHAKAGFTTERTLTFNWVLPGANYASGEKRVQTIDRATARLSQLPGVSKVALMNPLPLTGDGNQNSYYVEGAPLPEAGRHSLTEMFQASGDLFETLQIPLMNGRGFSAQDTATAPRVVVVDTMFVAKNFPGQDPLGKRVTFGARPPQRDSDWMTIVGVVAHIQNNGLGQPSREQLYVPYTQNPPGAFAFTVRTTQSPTALAATLRTAMREVAPDLPVFGVQTMDDLFVQSISIERLSMWLLSAFATLALVLAALGLYGVLAYNVGQRTREIGVRMALGATERSVVGLILRHGLKLAALGLGVGLLASIGLTRLLKAVLFEVSAFDPLSFAAVIVVLATIGLVACAMPARRAAKIHPMEALRSE